MDDELEKRIASLLREAEEAADPKTNGLMDREEFPILIRRLHLAILHLLGEREQARIRKDGCGAWFQDAANIPLEPLGLLGNHQIDLPQADNEASCLSDSLAHQ